MYSVKETARKMYCERRDEREAHRTVLVRCPDCKKVCGRHQHVPTVRERVHRQRLGKTAPNVQEHKRWSNAVEMRDSFCMVKNTAVSELESPAEAELYALTTGIAEGMVKNIS